MTFHFFTAVALAAAILPAVAQAGSFSVNPVRVDLSGSKPTAVVQVTNSGDAPVTVQLSMMSWSQPEGKDQLARSRDLLATPPIFTLEPGAMQAVRVGALRKPDTVTELPYRLLLQEIPSTHRSEFNGLHVALNVSLPVFLRAERPAPPDLRASVHRDDSHRLMLRLSNLGGSTAHLHDVSVFSKGPQDAFIEKQAASIYVLPGQHRDIALAASPQATTAGLRIRAGTNAGPIELDVSSAAP